MPSDPYFLLVKVTDFEIMLKFLDKSLRLLNLLIDQVVVHVCTRPFTLSNFNVSKTRWPIAIGLYLKHHCGKELTAKGFEADGIKTGFRVDK